MEKLYFNSIVAAVISCVVLSLASAMPFVIDNFNPDSTDGYYMSDACRWCLEFPESDACADCSVDLPEESVFEKRSGGDAYYHPFFRGGYPKKSSYNPYYNPMFRGTYLKKSFTPQQPIYHPFLRGGYGGGYKPQYQIDLDQDANV